ncbi:hypothetical protein [Spartinivicinus poritis]|uniref:Uncharacterized protein n=1 Tax=Spartinivicinus poritis TaxID=2994640 RepID=A0ABT5U4L2_9GAMM|nr:hypothetical protein [Spartinivicinus sp. A2-2]MDE1461298.1 hypothetical protein [Spartinivicinus sp. A2-2]
MKKLTTISALFSLLINLPLQAIEITTVEPTKWMDNRLKTGIRMQTHYHVEQKGKIGNVKYKNITNNTIKKGTISFWEYKPPNGKTVRWYARSNKLPDTIEPTVKWHHPFAKYDAEAAKTYTGRTTADGAKRFYDSEVKSIHHLYNLQKQGKVAPGGTLRGYVDKPACASCRDVLTAAERNGLAKEVLVFEAPESYAQTTMKPYRERMGEIAEQGENAYACSL